MSDASRIYPKAVGSTGRPHRMSPSLRARLAGALYFLAVAIAVFAEFFAPGRLGIADVILPVACLTIASLLLYSIFQPVSPRLALIAVLLNLTSLAFEALRFQPAGLNVAMVLHGVYSVLIGALMWRSVLLPRPLGVLMALAGLVWLIYLVPPLVHRLSPLNTAVGLLCEAIPMLWLLAMGVTSRTSRANVHATEEV